MGKPDRYAAPAPLTTDGRTAPFGPVRKLA